MKKQFFRVKQLADQTFLRADKSEVFNHEELHIADQKVEYLRNALSAIVKKLPHQGQNNDIDKRIKKCIEHHLAGVFLEQGISRKSDSGGFQEEPECKLFQGILRDCGNAEQNLAKDYADHEQQVEELVGAPIQSLLDNELPNILKQKRNLSKHILDKDSASNRYNSTKKEALKDDLEEADGKVEQSRDALAYEMFTLLAKENELASYILQLLKCQRSYHDSALKHLQEIIPKLEKRIGDSSVKRVFGISLKEHLRVTKKRIAYPLEICIGVLSKMGMSEEGLFRIAGGSSRVKRIKAAIDSGCFSSLIPEYQDVHVLASALKMYLRELPDPLLTSHLYNEWMQSMQRPESERLDVVKKLIDNLPEENRENLAYLMQFLAKLSSHKENKMTSSNIAIVIAPNLLWNNEEANISMGNCATVNMLVELFIKEVETLFPDDVSKLVTYSFRQDDEPVPKTAALGNNEISDSMENVSVTESPRPNTRKKKTPAPVPPNNNVISRTDQDYISEKNSLSASYPSGSSTLNRPQKPKELPKTVKASVGINTDDGKKSIIAQEEVHKSDVAKIAPLVNLDSTRTVEHKYVTQPATPVLVSKAKPVQPVIAQNANCDKNFKTIVTHHVNQENKTYRPVAAPRSIDGDKTITNKSSSANVMSKSASEMPTEVQLRKPEVASKPEIPARPVSLQKRSSADSPQDPAVHKTQCSVYSVAHKQQPSYVNVQNRNEKFQPGHDNQIAEKERFLGHQSMPSKISDINSNEKLGLPPKGIRSNENLEASKSNENLGDIGEKLNGNEKPSHVRTRSDGNLIELSDSMHGSLAQTPPSPRSLNKPTQPPPPPPVIAHKKEPDSTDL